MDSRVRGQRGFHGRSYLVIDGYNLMHAGGLARRKYGPGQLERCRSRLLRYLAQRLTAPERERTTIVFDAADAPPDLPREGHFEEMTFRFASSGKDADDMIEELIVAHSSPRQIRLVSSDHRLQRAARKRRATFLDSEDFIKELERRGLVSTSSQDFPDDEKELPGEAKERESENWLAIFGDIPGAIDVDNSRSSFSQADVAAIQEEMDRQERNSRPVQAPSRPKKKG